MLEGNSLLFFALYVFFSLFRKRTTFRRVREISAVSFYCSRIMTRVVNGKWMWMWVVGVAFWARMLKRSLAFSMIRSFFLWLSIQPFYNTYRCFSVVPKSSAFIHSFIAHSISAMTNFHDEQHPHHHAHVCVYLDAKSCSYVYSYEWCVYVVPFQTLKIYMAQWLYRQNVVAAAELSLHKF